MFCNVSKTFVQCFVCNTVLVFSKHTIENGVLRNRATVTPHIPCNSDSSITFVRTVFNRWVVPNHDGVSRTVSRSRVVPRSSAFAAILVRLPCHLVRSSRIAIRVGSHHTPTHQVQLRRIATKSTTSFRGGRHHHCPPRNTNHMIDSKQS